MLVRRPDETRAMVRMKVQDAGVGELAGERVTAVATTSLVSTEAGEDHPGWRVGSATSGSGPPLMPIANAATFG